MIDLQTLINGYQRFRDKYYRSSNRLFGVLKGGQTPGVMVIACSDSRVDPALLTECAPGDIFVVRNIANLVPGVDAGAQQYSTLSAVEYAVNVLRVGHIVVLGHSQCGGINALVRRTRGEDVPESIGRWIDCAAKTCSAVLHDHESESIEKQAELCERASIVASLENLRALPFLERALSSGILQLHGWYFDIQSGQLSSFDQQDQTFKALA